MNGTTRKLAVAVVLIAVAAAPATALLGIGDIVYDPTNYAQALQRFAQMQQQLAQLVQTYQLITKQYNQMLWMAQSVPGNMSVLYRALATPWLGSTATNTYGTTAGWIHAINSGLGAAAGYGQATQPLGTYGSGLGHVPADQLPRIQTTYANVELTDGASVSAIETIGRMRANAPFVETAIDNLEDDSLSSDPRMNTEIAVLNKINAAHLITVRNTQDANKLLVGLAEQQLIEAKRTRDAEAQAINNHIRFMTDGKAAMDSQASGASDAMLAWRMP